MAPSNTWRKGAIDELIPGDDGLIRGAVVRVISNGKVSQLRRPIQRLVPLEVQRASIDLPASTSTSSTTVSSSNTDTALPTAPVRVVENVREVSIRISS